MEKITKIGFVGMALFILIMFAWIGSLGQQYETPSADVEMVKEKINNENPKTKNTAYEVTESELAEKGVLDNFVDLEDFYAVVDSFGPGTGETMCPICAKEGTLIGHDLYECTSCKIQWSPEYGINCKYVSKKNSNNVYLFPK